MTGGFTPIDSLNEDHLLDEFDSGETELDEWLVQRGWRNQLSGFSRTYVTTDKERVVGYHAVAALVCWFLTRRAVPALRPRDRSPPFSSVGSRSIVKSRVTDSALHPAAAEFYKR